MEVGLVGDQALENQLILIKFIEGCFMSPRRSSVICRSVLGYTHMYLFREGEFYRKLTLF